MMRLLEVIDKANGYFFSESITSSDVAGSSSKEESITEYPSSYPYNCMYTNTIHTN